MLITNLMLPVNWKVNSIKIIFMDISQFSKLTGVPKKTLRYWEEIGVLPAPERSPNGYRQYDKGDFKAVKFILSAKAIGLSLGEIKSIMKLKKNEVPCNYVYNLLVERAEKIEERIENLKSIKLELEQLIKRASQLDLQNCSDDEICHIIPTKKLTV